MTAPAVFATYYYGACADVVDGESDTGNNCSAAVAVTVSARTATCAVDLGRSSGAGGTEGVEFALAAARLAQVGESSHPSWIHTEMGNATDFHVYEIALTSPGRLAVVTQSELDTQAVFLADDCMEVDAVQVVEDAGRVEGVRSSDLNFRLRGDLDAGTYYLVVYEWAGRTGDYSLGIYFDDPLVNDPPTIYRTFADQEIAVGDTATVFVYVSDDRGDRHTVVAESDNVDIATVAVTGATATDPGWFRAGERETAALRIAAAAEGTASVRVTVTDEHGSSHSTSPFTVTVTSPSLSAPTVGPGRAAGELEVTFTATFGSGETRAYDYQVRRKRPQSPWESVCVRWTNNGASELTASPMRTFTGLSAGVTFEVRYRYRGASSCTGGAPGRWSGRRRGPLPGGCQCLRTGYGQPAPERDRPRERRTPRVG